MIPKFFCPTCKKFKNRLQVSRKTDYFRSYWYECKWCHNVVQDTKELLQEKLADCEDENEGSN